MIKPDQDIVIRQVDGFTELREVENLQKEIWGVEDLEVLPALAMIPVRAVGGILLGAFAGTKMVGFSYAFPGIEDGHCALHSDMLAVKTSYRSHGLGYRLKLAQRKCALENGISTITWTFDPLQALNANLNFGKLGVISKNYRENFYGETSSFLHSTGTDRLWVTWNLNSQRVIDRLDRVGRNESEKQPRSEKVLRVVTVSEADEPAQFNDYDSDYLFVEIPVEINQIAKTDPRRAVRWREATRKAFTTALSSGLLVEDFFLIKENDQRALGRYLLAKNDHQGR